MWGLAGRPAVAYPGGWHGLNPALAVWYAVFDPSGVADVRAYQEPAAILIVWTTTNAAMTTRQVYIDGRLAWQGTADRVRLPYAPRPGEQVYIAVGTVGQGNRGVDFSGALAAIPNRAKLSWRGGRYLSPDLYGFHVYQGAGPGVAPDLARVAGDVKAAPGGVWNDGFGASGGFGSGGFGAAAVVYSWTSRPLQSGVWQFAVAAYDRAGNESAAPALITQAIQAAPPAPAPRAADGRRAWIESFDPTTGVYEIAWTV
jgi:hypothetical protein